MPIAESRHENLGQNLRRSTAFLSGNGFAARFLPFNEIEDLYGRVRTLRGGSWFQRLLDEMQVSLRVDGKDWERIPKTGPVLAVSNHPFGMLDGAVLGALLTQVRRDAKIMTNFFLAAVPELQEHCIFVDPLNGRESVQANRRALRQALLWLREGHMLAVFPAGEVSHLQLTQGSVTDPKWNPMIARLARVTGAAALPVFFPGRNSVTFQTLGLMHPRLRTAWLMSEFLSQAGKTVEIRIGTPVPGDVLARLHGDQETIDYLRRRTYLLSRRSRAAPGQFLNPNFVFPRKEHAPIAAETARDALLAEIQQLDPGQLLEDTREFSVYVARAQQIPSLLRELGRLREITFRDVGEGTGESRDLDPFDAYYLHVFLWDKAKQQLAGAYRMGIGPEILARRGPRGLYTSTLFHYDPRFFEKLGPAVELGRSFVLPDYQRQFAPLLLLWRGIARYLSDHPETPVLFGAVSISNRYSPASRELIVRYFESRQPDEMSGLVRPRRPFRSSWLRPWDCTAICHSLRDLEDLGASVSDLETDAKGIPILLRQYAKLGGRLLAFNVDRDFSDVLDGLVLVDLRQTDTAVLERYMGKQGLARFRGHHLLSDPLKLDTQEPSPV